jgi:ferredoxin
MTVRVVVNPELCQGHTLCNMAAPDIFHLRDEDGHAYVVVDELTAEQVPLARQAELGCPERAITVEE